MGKELAKRVGIAAIQSMLEDFLPGITERLDAIERRMEKLETENRAGFREIEGRFLDVHQKIADKFEATQDVINELAQRIANQEGRLELLIRSIDRNTDKTEELLERVLTVEINSPRRRKAG